MQEVADLRREARPTPSTLLKCCDIYNKPSKRSIRRRWSHMLLLPQMDYVAPSGKHFSCILGNTG